ncbi:unnamed protein product [Symbiodinium sp. KB8]|nr:unnamed protein product [Symbiodinium sp. KB8]
MDSDSLGSEAVPDEKTAIPKIEPCAAGGPAPLQQEPIDQEGLEDDEIQTRIDLLKDLLVHDMHFGALDVLCVKGTMDPTVTIKVK